MKMSKIIKNSILFHHHLILISFSRKIGVTSIARFVENMVNYFPKDRIKELVHTKMIHTLKLAVDVEPLSIVETTNEP